MSDTFDIAAVRSRLSKAAVDVLETARDLGWKLEWASAKQQAITMRSTFDDRKLLLPLTSVNANRLRSLKTQVARHTDPEVLADASDLTRLANRNRREGRIPATFDLASGFKVSKIREEPDVARKTAVEQAMEDALAVEPVTPAPKPQRPAIFRGGDKSVHLVSETPWMVRKGGHEGGHGRMYESHSVIHRVWSDGAEDYRCRFCEYTSENPRGVAGHASRTKTGHPAQSEATELHKVNEYEPSEIKRPMSGIRRLTTELTLALDGLKDWCDLSPEELARTLAEQVYAMRPDREPAEPLTAEQIVHRITLMVDTGRLAEMHQQVEHMAGALVEATDARNRLTDEVIAAQQQVTALREERRVLAQMLSTEDDS